MLIRKECFLLLRKTMHCLRVTEVVDINNHKLLKYLCHSYLSSGLLTMSWTEVCMEAKTCNKHNNRSKLFFLIS